MRNVAGLSTTDAQKSSDMFGKCRYMDERTGNRGVVFATGTPVSNSMTELYTMQRYLQYARLEEMHMTHFDCWASRFGETVTALELAPEGKGYRPRTRFSRFFNLPELMNLFKEVADIKTADQLHLPVPEVEYHNVVAKPTEVQKGLVQELSERAAAIHSGSVDPSIDNMLKVTSDGRKLGLDQRIIKGNRCYAAFLQPLCGPRGFDAVIREMGRLTEQRIELTEDSREELDRRQQLLVEHLSEHPEVSVTYFVSDERKSGGAYVTVSDGVKKIDRYQRLLVLNDDLWIPLNEIIVLDSDIY